MNECIQAWYSGSEPDPEEKDAAAELNDAFSGQPSSDEQGDAAQQVTDEAADAIVFLGY